MGERGSIVKNGVKEGEGGWGNRERERKVKGGKYMQGGGG